MDPTHSKAQELHRKIYELFKQNPLNTTFVEALSAIPANTPELCDVILQYKNFITPRTYTRPSRPPLRIVVQTHIMNSHVLRIAHTIKATGASMLLLMAKTPKNIELITSYRLDRLFEDIQLYTEFIATIPALRQVVAAFRGDIVHAFSNCSQALDVALWLSAFSLPVVADAYDLHNVLYDLTRPSSAWLKPSAAIEQLWLRRVDGLCMRSRYIKALKKKCLYREKTPVIFLGDPTIQQTYTAAYASPVEKLSSKDGKLHILASGLFNEPDSGLDNMDGILPYMQDAGIVLHVQPLEWTLPQPSPAIAENFERLQRYDFVQVHQFMPPSEYLNFMSSMDILTQNLALAWRPDNIYRLGYDSNNFPYTLCVKFIEAVEHDTVVLFPDVMIGVTQALQHTHRSIPLRPDQACTAAFWQQLQDQVRALRSQPPSLDRMSDVYHAPRLDAFYRKVLCNYISQKSSWL